MSKEYSAFGEFFWDGIEDDDPAEKTLEYLVAYLRTHLKLKLENVELGESAKDMLAEVMEEFASAIPDRPEPTEEPTQ